MGKDIPDTPGAVIDMYVVKEHATAAGSHWFEPAAMRFFRSRLSRDAIVGTDGRCYFVSSEQPPYDARVYSVRAYDPSTGKVETVGPFCGYASNARAKRAARAAAGV